jgi:hypothetical protein
MPDSRKSIGTVKVFVASPSDVSRERECLSGVINELNRTISALLSDVGIRLELVRWETNAFPAMGRPQGIILDQIGDYDIFVGILWRRFGTPTGVAQSGTEEEFRLAYETWKKHGKPHILIYFNRSSISIPRTIDDVEQLSKLVAFREEVSKIGLIWEYDGDEQFPDVVRPHLTEVIGTLIRGKAVDSTQDVREDISKLQTPSATGVESGGLRVRIAEIGDKDAFREDKDLIGRAGVIIEIFPRDDGWYRGKIRLDEPRAGFRDYTFAQFRYEAV